MRISLKAINSELERLGSHALLAKGDGYFYFWDGEAADWLDRTVRVPTLQSLTLEQWIEQFRLLRAPRSLNRSPRSIERSKTLAGIQPPLDPSMVLFHKIV